MYCCKASLLLPTDVPLRSFSFSANYQIMAATIPSIVCTHCRRPLERGTVDHSRPDCLISGDQQSQDRRTKLSVSGKQLLRYVPEYVDSWLPILLQLSSHRRSSASKRPPRACSTCVPRKANRMWLTSHCMSLVAAADSETTHTAK